MGEQCPHRPGGRVIDCALCQPLLGKEAEETKTLYYASGRWKPVDEAKTETEKKPPVRHSSTAVGDWAARHGSD
ncbi:MULTISPECIES: hypothetical protein [unclassified Haladaptatus]|uniref:hypothetical protein n=1 Tax=unclassified Haladaptatus TaxID=2622732 RepID=UPI0023E7C2E7|nr:MULTISPECIES: hypothetical protein [unclassified Haladaptatus]